MLEEKQIPFFVLHCDGFIAWKDSTVTNTDRRCHYAISGTDKENVLARSHGEGIYIDKHWFCTANQHVEIAGKPVTKKKIMKPESVSASFDF